MMPSLIRAINIREGGVEVSYGSLRKLSTDGERTRAHNAITFNKHVAADGPD